MGLTGVFDSYLNNSIIRKDHIILKCSTNLDKKKSASTDFGNDNFLINVDFLDTLYSKTDKTIRPVVKFKRKVKSYREC